MDENLNSTPPTPALGHLKDPSDSRDLLWRAAVAPQALSMPMRFRLSSLGSVMNQGDKPHCVAFGAATLKMHQEFKEHKKYYGFDPTWLYDLCKQQDGIPNVDGTYIRVALKIIQDTGYLAKAERYKLKKDTHFKIDKYVRLTSMQQMKEAIYHVGPVVFGITVDQSIYMPNKFGVIPEPKPSSAIGGHCMVAVGWNDAKKCQGSKGAFLVKQSWGREYGNKGYIWIPYTHFEEYSDFDAWRTVDAKDLYVEA